ncbi:mitochondrial ribosomal protein L37-domain-containing protein [Parachaetomium inaequale]|uniref:Large ribosomal subunit protein mL54 n=1 Tax=Parachaetomium inaequale TaxID=2588326 RepID=A0AAN6PR89_9PEZI|nr:mitochondrial ribosomal protein L37-domain-containing protein [Parachaetomium inaequale]
MPTPESEAFLAKKPKVPPTFDGVDYDDTKRLKQAQDAIIREQWVQVMMGRLVREELSKCYYREGVNHLEKCGRLRERYLELLANAKVKGYLFEQQNYFSKDGFTTRQITAQPLARTSAAAATRPFTTTLTTRNAAPSPAAAAPATASASASDESSSTPDLTPLTPPAADSSAPSLSSCPAGTVLNGLNYFKGKTDPVALADDAYPAWLWKCLEVQKKADAAADADAGDEFSKSKKQRRLALKRQRLQEARLLASGDLEALVPKIPLQKQTVNLPAAAVGDLGQALEAVDKREELRQAMRKERRAKIKEANYLKAM